MRTAKVVILVAFVCVLVVMAGYIGRVTFLPDKEFDQVKANRSAVFIPEENRTAFEDASSTAAQFYGELRRALKLKKEGQLNESARIIKSLIPEAHFKNETAMLYNQLAEISRTQNDLENELSYLKEYQKWTLNDVLRREAQKREQEIQQLLGNSNGGVPREDTLK